MAIAGSCLVMLTRVGNKGQKVELQRKEGAMGRTSISYTLNQVAPCQCYGAVRSQALSFLLR